MPCVYCLRVGTQDLFKVGRTKQSAAERTKNVSVGSALKMSVYRTVETEAAVYLEQFIHKLLDARRAPNGEFFNVTCDELDAAIEKAESFVKEFTPSLEGARKLERRKPTGSMIEASADVAELHRQLRVAEAQMFFLEQHVKHLQNQLKIAIGENNGISGFVTWKWRDQEVFDQVRLKAERPDIFTEYKRVRGARVFQLLRGVSESTGE